jgi:hypothetical protein
VIIDPSARIAELEAEVERLRNELNDSTDVHARRTEQEQRAAANALLERLHAWDESEGTTDDLVRICQAAAAHLSGQAPARSAVESEVDEMFCTFGFEEQDDEPRCTAAPHGPRNSTCTCEDSRDE